MSSGVLAQSGSYDRQVGEYIIKYSPVAMLEMQQYKIPASITLAQGILESAAGQSRLAREANNHFGIKCHKEWKGNTFYQPDETARECFRSYSNAEESFRDHSYFLSSRDRYKSLFSLPVTDYKAWAMGLQSAGYATNPQYSSRLIHLIEQYELFLYDRPGQLPSGSVADAGPDYDRYPWIASFEVTGTAADGRNLYENNGIPCIVSRTSDDPGKISALSGVSVNKILKFNDLGHGRSLQTGQVVYLKAKKRKAAIQSHTVSGNEDLYEISQRYGVKLKLVVKRSGMSERIQPYKGQVIPLR